MAESSLMSGNVIVQDNSVLTIPASLSLTIPSGSNITIEHGSGVLIKSGGSLQIEFPFESSSSSVNEFSTSSVVLSSSSTSENSNLVDICHVAGKKTTSIKVNQNAAYSHLRHGDSLGSCE